MKHLTSICLFILPMSTCVLGGKFGDSCEGVALPPGKATIKAYCQTPFDYWPHYTTLDLEKCVANNDGKLVVSKQLLVQVRCANIHSVLRGLFRMLHPCYSVL